MLKKKISLMLCVMMMVCLCACSGSSTKSVNIINVSSDLYSQEDIDSAIKTITTEFEEEWSGCTLTEISYAGDETTENYKDWAERNNADEVIVLVSSFDVAASGADASLTPDSTYDHWNWILVRNKGGQWEHVDHGY
jgi:hypothetical protein